MVAQRIAKYDVGEFIGGGMSHVYRATDTEANRTVALKLMSEAALADSDARASIPRRRIRWSTPDERVAPAREGPTGKSPPTVTLRRL